MKNIEMKMILNYMQDGYYAYVNGMKCLAITIHGFECVNQYNVDTMVPYNSIETIQVRESDYEDYTYNEGIKNR